MSDLAIPGINGKYTDYIEKLGKVEEVRRQPLDNAEAAYRLQRQVWQETGKTLQDLNIAVKQLFGFEGVFADRTAKSSDESIVTVDMSRYAKPGSINMKVDRMAKTDRFYSKELAADYTVPAGKYTFSVGEQDVVLDYPGGGLSDFGDQLNKVSPELFKMTVVASSEGKSTLLVESLKTGKENTLNFKDAARTLAFNTDIITDKVNAKYRVESDSSGILRAGESADLQSEVKLTVGRRASFGIYPPIPVDLKPGAYLAFSYKSAIRSMPTATMPSPVSMGKEVIEGHLPLNMSSETLPLPTIPASSPISLKIDGVETSVGEALVPIETYTPIKIDLGAMQGSVGSITLNNMSGLGEVDIRDLVLSVPGSADFIPANAVSIAQDASFSIDGVKATRPTNKINDLLPGYGFVLQGEDPLKEVTIRIANNIKAASDAVQQFVWQYNVNMAKINTVLARKDNIGIVDEIAFYNDKQREAAEKQLGTFFGDQTFIAMKNRLHTFMIQAYPITPEGDQKYLLAKMGISTNAGLGSGGDENRRGYFEIDTKKLDAALQNNWDDARKTFALDSTGNGVADKGLAVEMDKYIRGYTSLTGLIKVKSGTLDSQITAKQREITDFNKALEEKKAKWRIDFGKAEDAENRMKQSTNQLNGYFGNNNRNN